MTGTGGPDHGAEKIVHEQGMINPDHALRVGLGARRHGSSTNWMHVHRNSISDTGRPLWVKTEQTSILGADENASVTSRTKADTGLVESLRGMHDFTSLRDGL